MVTTGPTPPRATIFSDDDEFVIEFDEEEAGSRNLESMFDPNDDPFAGEDEMPAETEELFEAANFMSAENQFEGARERPAFVEDLAGWHGEDVDLGEIVGETPGVEHEEVGDPALEFEEGLDDDPFAIDDVEVESLDGGADWKANAPRPAPVLGDSDEAIPDVVPGAAAAAGDDDSWSPLPEQESWSMGEEIAEAGAEIEEAAAWTDGNFVTDEGGAEVAPQAAFGSGRSDTFGSGELGDEPVEEDYVDPIYGDISAGIDAVEEDYVDDGEPVGLVEDGSTTRTSSRRPTSTALRVRRSWVADRCTGSACCASPRRR